MPELTAWTRIKGRRRWGDETEGERGPRAVDRNRQALLEFSRDYDRILYSTAFRRLGGVTQVVSASETPLFHNRLTHSLKTAQVGARIANELLARASKRDDLATGGGIDPRVVRAACMAHDLGHPPFGHIAEMELQTICSREPNKVVRARDSEREARIERTPVIADAYGLDDGFEGNAQSFRIVTKLAFREKSARDGGSHALDLTRATLAAMLKYPWSRAQQPTDLPDTLDAKWGYYRSELDIVRWIFEGQDRPPRRDTGREFAEYRTLEAQIMDWADDISYAVHDVEDFFRAGLIPLNALRSESEATDFLTYAWDRRLKDLCTRYEFDQAARRVCDRLPRRPYEGSRADRENLHGFASTLIKDAIRKTELHPAGGIVPEKDIETQIEILKQLAWYYVIDRPSLESVQRGQRKLIRRLYGSLVEWVEECWRGPRAHDDPQRRTELPNRLLEYLDVAFAEGNDTNGYRENQRISRAVVDYIVSLTEPEAMELGTRLFGTSPHTMLDNWGRF